MKIGIIGAGYIGGNLTRRLSALGHDVSVANSRGPETLAELAAETGASAVAAADAPRDAEIVIVTVPMLRVPELAGVLDAAPGDAIVIDTNNYYPRERDGAIEAIEAGSTESRWVSGQLGRPVIKAFNGIRAKRLLDSAKAPGEPDRIALPVAGDDAHAKEVVMRLIDELGFDPVDAGSIDESWRQQPGTPVYGANLDASHCRRALEQALPERPDAFSA